MENSMKHLFRCRCCGFLSTLGSEFTRIDGLTVDKDCAEKIKQGMQPAVRWFAEAKADEAQK
jgi:hypothetical protein